MFGLVSSVQVHWLCVLVPADCSTFASLPGRYWPSSAGVTASQAFGTVWKSPFWKVVTSGGPAVTGVLLSNGQVLVSHPATIRAATTTTAPITVSLRRDFRARVAAWRPLPRSGGGAQGTSSSSPSCQTSGELGAARWLPSARRRSSVRLRRPPA